MAREREEQVLEQLNTLSDQVVDLVHKLSDQVDRFASDDYDELDASAREMDLLESTTDETKERLLDQLAGHAVFPMGRADLATLVTSMDGIANLAVGAADRLAMRRFTLPQRMNELLVELAQVDAQTVEALREVIAALNTDLREAIDKARGIDKMESRADDIYAELYRDMFEWDTDYKTFHQVKSIIGRLESIADKCNEVAEQVRHMALEYLENR